jgi:DNA topoisomerase-1
MRTDSTYVAPSAVREVREYIRERFGDDLLPRQPRTFTRKAIGTQEAHEAIRPTSIRREPQDIKPYLNPDQFRLYELIWRRMVASQMADALSLSTTVEVEATCREAPKIYTLRATDSVLRFPGFRTIYMEGRDEGEEEGEGKRPLPELERGEPLDCLGLEPRQHFTQPPPRYTEATLIKALEEKGIGRPSTYAPIISTILERGYVLKEEGRFKPSALGKAVCDLLVQFFPNIMDLDFTAQMEEGLDAIARGEKEWVPMLREFYGPFQGAVEEALRRMPRVKVEEPTQEVCEKCGRPMVVKSGRFGRFLSCSGFPNCRNAKPLLVRTGVECPQCGGELVERRSNKGKAFYGCSHYPTCNFTVRWRPLPEPCPECGGLLVAYGRGRARCTACGHRGPIPEEEKVAVEG